MKYVLMSIQSEHVEQIRLGNKCYEFRKSVPLDKSVTKMLIYCGRPTMRVVAECYIECIIEDTPENIWYKTSDKSGVTKEFFDSYFEGFEKAYAIKLSNIHFFPESIPLSTFNLSRPPRLFQYVTM